MEESAGNRGKKEETVEKGESGGDPQDLKKRNSEEVKGDQEPKELGLWKELCKRITGQCQARLQEPRM